MAHTHTTCKLRYPSLFFMQRCYTSPYIYAADEVGMQVARVISHQQSVPSWNRRAK